MKLTSEQWSASRHQKRLYWSPLTFLQGFDDTSKEALKARLCCVVRMVLGRLGLLESLLSSPFPWLMPFSCLMSSSSSSLFSADRSEMISPDVAWRPLCTLSPKKVVGLVDG